MSWKINSSHYNHLTASILEQNVTSDEFLKKKLVSYLLHDITHSGARVAPAET